MIRPRSSTLATLLLAVLAAAAPPRDADAVVLCARKANGAAVPNEGAAVKVRTTACRDNEATLDPSALGLASGLTTVVRTGNQVSTNHVVSTPAVCADGEVATGGGVLAQAADGGIAVVRSSRPEPDTPGGTPTSWRSTVENVSASGTITATAYVVCAPPPP